MKKLTALILILSLGLSLNLPGLVQANVPPKCTFNSLSPSTISTNVSTNVTFNLSNTSGSPVVWVKLTSATDLYTLASADATGWTGTVSTMEATFTGGSLADQASGNFNVVIHTGSDQPSEAWTAQVSNSADGSNPISCTGSFNLTVAGDTTPPNLNSVTVTDITTSSAKINWTTDEASTGSIDYGTSTSYGTNQADTSLSTSHSLTVSGLNTYTIYHFRVNIADSAGNASNSDDETFTTAKDSSSSGTSSTTNTTVTTTVVSTPTPTPTPIPDTTPPTVSLDQDLSQPFKSSPAMKGHAQDNKGMSSVSYSLDGGKNWLKVDQIDLKGKSASFEFSPAKLEDGNYPIKVKATDTSGNVGLSPVYTLVIDRLPPQVSSTSFYLGSQRAPNSQGLILKTIVGADQKLFLSAVGGPTSIDIQGVSDQPLSLSQQVESGLWTGDLVFSKPGIYQLIAHSIDGAKNTTSQTLGTVQVSPPGQISDLEGQPLPEGQISVFSFEPNSQTFKLWDGAAFGQANPLQFSHGNYQFELPAGRYYLSIQAPGYGQVNSTIFELTQTTAFNSEFKLAPRPYLQLGPFQLSWPSLFTQPLPINVQQLDYSQPSNLVGQELAPFKLQTNGSELTDLSLRGKPTLLTFLNSWDMTCSQQLSELENLNQSDYQVVVIFPQQSISAVASFQKRGGYHLTMLADPDGQLVQPLSLYNLPTHIFVSNKGLVQTVETGFLSKDQIQAQFFK